MRELLKYEKRPAAVSAKNAARDPHRIPVNARLLKVLPATTKAILISINKTDGHTHNFICDNRTVDKTTGMKVTPASTSRRQPSRSNTGVNRMASRKERSRNKSGRDWSLVCISGTLLMRVRSSELRVPGARETGRGTGRPSPQLSCSGG